MSKFYKNSQSQDSSYDFINTFPNWYWVNGLHDAKILSVNFGEDSLDWNYNDTLYERMEILLDGNGAMFEQDITKITFYKCNLVSGELPNLEKVSAWWIDDIPSKNSNINYKLQIKWADEDNYYRTFNIEFDNAEIERKSITNRRKRK